MDGLLDLRDFFKDTSFRYLDGDYAKIELEAGIVGIAGLGLEDYSDKILLGKMLAKLGKTDATMLLCHVPDALKTAEGLPVTVLFSGHTHGYALSAVHRYSY